MSGSERHLYWRRGAYDLEKPCKQRNGRKVVSGQMYFLLLPVCVNDLLPIGHKALTDDFEKWIGEYHDKSPPRDANLFLGMRTERSRDRERSLSTSTNVSKESNANPPRPHFTEEKNLSRITNPGNPPTLTKDAATSDSSISQCGCQWPLAPDRILPTPLGPSPVSHPTLPSNIPTPRAAFLTTLHPMKKSIGHSQTIS